MYLTDPLDEFAITATLIGLLLGGYFVYKTYQQDKYENVEVSTGPYRSISRLKFIILFGIVLLYPLIMKVLFGVSHPIPGLSNSFVPDLIGLIGSGLIWISICAAIMIYFAGLTNIYRRHK